MVVATPQVLAPPPPSPPGGDWRGTRLIFIAAVIPLLVLWSGVRCAPDRDRQLENMLAVSVVSTLAVPWGVLE